LGRRDIFYCDVSFGKNYHGIRRLLTQGPDKEHVLALQLSYCIHLIIFFYIFAGNN